MEQLRKPGLLSVQTVRLVQADVLEHDGGKRQYGLANLLNRIHLDTGQIMRNEPKRQRRMLSRRRIPIDGRNEQIRRVLPVVHECLRSVENQPSVDGASRRAHTHGVRTALGLGYSKGERQPPFGLVPRSNELKLPGPGELLHDLKVQKVVRERQSRPRNTGELLQNKRLRHSVVRHMVATMNNAEAIEIEITHHLVGQTGIVLPLANSLTCKMLLAEFAHRRNKLLVFRCEIEIHDAAPFAVHDGSHQAECSLCAESRRRNKRKAAKEAHQKAHIG